MLQHWQPQAVTFCTSVSAAIGHTPKCLQHSSNTGVGVHLREACDKLYCGLPEPVLTHSIVVTLLLVNNIWWHLVSRFQSLSACGKLHAMQHLADVAVCQYAVIGCFWIANHLVFFYIEYSGCRSPVLGAQLGNTVLPWPWLASRLYLLLCW